MKAVAISIGGGLNRRTLVYDKDVGRAAVLAVSHPAAAGRVFNVTDGEFHTLSEIIESICSALGRKPPSFSLFVVPIRFALWRACWKMERSFLAGTHQSRVLRSTNIRKT